MINKIVFSDLTHTGVTIDTNYFPLGVAYVAAYAKGVFKDSVDVDIFKYPEELSNYLNDNTPRVACFSNFSWNFKLSYKYAEQIKNSFPDVIVVFGGPNYPNSPCDQEAFLKAHPVIDFYVVGEGEVPFASLLEQLESNEFDIQGFTANSEGLANTHYYKNGKFVRGELSPRIKDLSVIPSPILTGLMDKFIEGNYLPMVQTNRGCPYSCAFCHDGDRYQSKIGRFPKERYEQELEYIAGRTKVPFLLIPDLNFGMFKEDLDTAKYIQELKATYGWPAVVDLTAAKNHKERISDIIDLFKDTFLAGASVQSTDQQVLNAIKRKNLPMGELAKLSKKSAEYGGNSFSEIILCLPGDSKRAHFQSVFDMLEAGIDELRMYQFILLDGTEAATPESREKYGYQTRWRVLPRCMGEYDIYGKKHSVAEFHEVCVASNTMSYQDYRDCRTLNLVVEIFNNGKMFKELLQFLGRHDVPASSIINRLYAHAVNGDGALGRIVKDFAADEEMNFFDTREELESFLSQPDVLNLYLSGKYGANQIMRYRSVALLQYLEENTNLIFAIAREELRAANKLNDDVALYLHELAEMIKACKGDLLSIEKSIRKTFHFDFVTLSERNFNADPLELAVPDGVEISIGHSPNKIKELRSYLEQYGDTVDGLGHLMQRANIFQFYRHPHYVYSRQAETAGL